MNPRTLIPHISRGFSLVELLVAMTLGLFLVSGMIAVFAGNKRSAELNTAMSTLQENARFALDAIVRDLRMAGHQGCLDSNGGAVSIRANAPPTADLASTAVTGAVITDTSGWDPVPALGSGTAAFSAPTDRPAVPGTHAVVAQFGGPSSHLLAAPMRSGGIPSPSATLQVAGAPDLQVGDYAIVSSCETGELFQVTGVTPDGDDTLIAHGAGANDSGAFNTAYGRTGTDRQTRVMPFTTSVYYVAETGREDTEGRAVRALYQWSMPFDESVNPPVELIDGVDNLRVSFAVGAGLGQLRYMNADHDDFDPRDVRGVRVGLLMSSLEDVAADDDETVYVLAGQPISPAATAEGDEYETDKRFRLAFNTTVKVRNRRAIR